MVEPDSSYLNNSFSVETHIIKKGIFNWQGFKKHRMEKFSDVTWDKAKATAYL
jgi:hypothetical protein